MEEAIAMVLSLLVVFMAAERNGLISIDLAPATTASAPAPGVICDQMSFYCIVVDESGRALPTAAAIGP